MKPAVRLIASLVALMSVPARAGTTAGASSDVVIPGYSAEGEKSWELHARRIDPVDGSEHEMDGTEVRIVVYDKSQKVLHVATAQKGRVDTQSKDAILRGNVVIRFGDDQSTRVETEELSWHGSDGTAHTDLPVKIVRKDMTVTGVGLDLKVREDKTDKQQPKRADVLVVRRSVRTYIEPTNQSWLLPSDQPEKPEARQPAVPGPAKPGAAAPAAAPAPAAPAPEPEPSEKPAEAPAAAPAEPAAAAEPAKAPPPAKPEKPGEPIVITCVGSLTVLRSEMKAIYLDHVRAVQGNKSLTADKLTLILAPSDTEKGKALLDHGTAEGDVRIDDAQTIALADTAIWSRKDDSTKLIGQPAEVRWDNGNRLASPVIYRLHNGTELLCMPAENTQGRVHLLSFVTPSGVVAQEKPDGPGEKPAPPAPAPKD